MITSHSKIQFHSLKSSKNPNQKGEYTITRWDTDDTITAPEEVVAVIKELTHGNTVHDAAKNAGVTIDNITSILRDLRGIGFIKSVDGSPLKDKQQKIHPWISGIRRGWFAWIVSKPVLLISFLFILSGIAIGLTNQSYLPSYKNYFWIDDIFIVIVSLQLIGFLLLFIHEVGHFIVTKAIGGEAIMRFSYRYIYFIAETESYHIGAVPKELRYLVYFAGMFVDFLVIALCYWIMFLVDTFQIEIGLFRLLLPAIIVLNIQGIVWQYNAFLKTDMYNFLSDYLNHDNLHANTIRFIYRKMRSFEHYCHFKFPGFIRNRISHHPELEDADDLRYLHATERKQLTIYSFILVTGIIFITIQFIFFIFPREFIFVSFAAQGFVKAMSDLNFIEALKSLLVLCMMVYQYFFVLFLVHKSRQTHGKL